MQLQGERLHSLITVKCRIKLHQSLQHSREWFSKNHFCYYYYWEINGRAPVLWKFNFHSKCSHLSCNFLHKSHNSPLRLIKNYSACSCETFLLNFHTFWMWSTRNEYFDYEKVDLSCHTLDYYKVISFFSSSCYFDIGCTVHIWGLSPWVTWM